MPAGGLLRQRTRSSVSSARTRRSAPRPVSTSERARRPAADRQRCIRRERRGVAGPLRDRADRRRRHEGAGVVRGRRHRRDGSRRRNRRARGTGGREKPGGSVEALDSDGNVVATADAKDVPFGVDRPRGVTTRRFVDGSGARHRTVADYEVRGDGADSPSAATVRGGVQPPPPALPAAGEQPADPAAPRPSRAGLRDRLLRGLGDDDEKRAVVQDSDALTDVMEKIDYGSLRATGQGRQRQGHRGRVHQSDRGCRPLRHQRGELPDELPRSDRQGAAHRRRWKVAKVTVCADISLAGGNCPAP